MFIRKWEDGEVEQLQETPAITQLLFKIFFLLQNADICVHQVLIPT